MENYISRNHHQDKHKNQDNQIYMEIDNVTTSYQNDKNSSTNQDEYHLQKTQYNYDHDHDIDEDNYCDTLTFFDKLNFSSEIEMENQSHNKEKNQLQHENQSPFKKYLQIQSDEENDVYSNPWREINHKDKKYKELQECIQNLQKMIFNQRRALKTAQTLIKKYEQENKFLIKKDVQNQQKIKQLNIVLEEFHSKYQNHRNIIRSGKRNYSTDAFKLILEYEQKLLQQKQKVTHLEKKIVQYEKTLMLSSNQKFEAKVRQNYFAKTQMLLDNKFIIKQGQINKSQHQKTRKYSPMLKPLTKNKTSQYCQQQRYHSHDNQDNQNITANNNYFRRYSSQNQKNFHLFKSFSQILLNEKKEYQQRFQKNQRQLHQIQDINRIYRRNIDQLNLETADISYNCRNYLKK